MSTTQSKVKVLFVCMGNICRSPTGEGVFRDYVEQLEAGDQVVIDSAGTISYHAGVPADPRMCDAAARRGYTLDSIARGVVSNDLSEFDLVIAMDHDNFDDLNRLPGAASANIRMLGEFVPGVRAGRAPPVPDPYYGGAAGFEAVIDMIESACPALFAHCMALLDRGDAARI